MHTATIHSLDQARQSSRSGARIRPESSPAHERRSSLTGRHAPTPVAAGDGVERTADLLLAMEAHPLAPVTCWVITCADRRARVAIRVGTSIASALLDPRDARFTADILFDEQAFAAAAGVADDIHRAAGLAETMNGLPLRPSRPFRSSQAALLGMAGIAAVLFGLLAADAVKAWLGA